MVIDLWEGPFALRLTKIFLVEHAYSSGALPLPFLSCHRVRQLLLALSSSHPEEYRGKYDED